MKNTSRIIKENERYTICLSKELLNELNWSPGDEITIEKLTYSKCNTKKIILKQGLVLKNEKRVTR